MSKYKCLGFSIAIFSAWENKFLLFFSEKHLFTLLTFVFLFSFFLYNSHKNTTQQFLYWKKRLWTQYKQSIHTHEHKNIFVSLRWRNPRTISLIHLKYFDFIYHCIFFYCDWVLFCCCLNWVGASFSFCCKYSV